MKKLLYLAANWPEPASSAAGTRTLQLLSLFREEDWEITLLSAAEKRPHTARLPSDIRTLPLWLNDSKMDAVFEELNPEAVIFDRFMLEEQYGWRIESCCPGALRILDSIDLHSLREIRRKALHENRKPEMKDWFCDSALREIASIHRCDLTLLISDAEYEILTRELHLPASLLTVLPFLLSPEEQQSWQDSPSFSDRTGFVSIGNFRHPPNADSIQYLYKTLWPQIRKQCPEADMHVYGADITPAIQTLHQPRKGFHVHGRADDALEVMRNARVCLAPLRFGAGLKGKLLDAMLAGTPSVTTPIGAEGMQGHYEWPGAIAESPDDWVAAAIDLHQQESTWTKAQQHIAPLLAGRFDRTRFKPSFLDQISRLASLAHRHAPDQLTGALLRHHQHRSTEYMSRWIEAKNRTKRN
ncbi:glycosyltransferase [Kiritimatiellaeota bacterium B1221]|nr:glycosyltransferase [Kiritimatiellaeota bacterium B1221]